MVDVRTLLQDLKKLWRSPMKPLCRSVGILVLAAALLNLGMNLFLNRVSEVWNPRDRHGKPISLVGEHKKRVRLDQQIAKAMDRIAFKEKIVSSVLAGEMTLFEAAAGFAEADAAFPEDLDPLHAFSGASEEEKLCRLVIEWVVKSAADERSADETALLRTKLEAELQEHLDRYDMVKLPNDVSWGKRE
jgi:hypothetical protein